MGSFLNKLSKAISICLANVAAVTLIFWAFIIVIFVAARSLFNVNWMFIEEYTGYGMVLLTSFSFAYALRRGAHVRVTALVNNISKKKQETFLVLANLVGLAVAVYLTCHGIRWLLQGIEGGERSWFPSRTLLWPVYALIPIGMAALSLEFLNQLISSISSFRVGRK